MNGVGQGHVLVVDDDVDMVFLLRRLLEGSGYEVKTAADGPAAIASYQQDPSDLVLLDVNLPLADGLDVCRRLRAISSVPILMLSCHREDYDKVVGLETGADDYLGKPFSPAELLARVKALLRRARASEGREELRQGALQLFPASREVYHGSQPLNLTPIEFSLLEEMMRRRGDAIRRSDLLRAIWGDDFDGQTRTVDTHIRNLRQKLPSESGVWVEAVRGIGFKLVDRLAP